MFHHFSSPMLGKTCHRFGIVLMDAAIESRFFKQVFEILE